MQLFGVVVGDVGEDPAFRGFVDEVGFACVEEGDDGAGGFVHDVVDHFERVLGALAEGDEGDVGLFLPGDGGDLVDLDAGGNDDVAEAGKEIGEDPEALLCFSLATRTRRLCSWGWLLIELREGGSAAFRGSKIIAAPQWRLVFCRPGGLEPGPVASALGYMLRGHNC